MLERFVSDVNTLHGTGFIAAFVLTALLILLFKDKLPRDHGRKFAVEGKLSEGKARGAGIILVSVFVIAAALFCDQTAETLIYLLLIILSMLTGYFDDASEKPWKDYKKAIFDFVISAGITAMYIVENGTSVQLLLIGVSFTMPGWLFAILGVILVWASINVTNCTDGVDGLSSSVGIVTLSSFAIVGIMTTGAIGASYMWLLFCACLLAYILFNANPSSVLMGDAGSRAMGTLIAIAALKSGDPFLWLAFGLVFILDGGIGLIKLFLARYLKIRILKNVLTPLHDHVRKNIGWSNVQTMCRFTIIQIMISAAVLWLVK